MKLENLYDYIFWYNPYEEVWYAVHREYQLDFFNGNRNNIKFIKSKQHSTLMELLCKENLSIDLN